MANDDDGDKPLTANYVVKYMAPLVVTVFGVTGWLIRLEAKTDQNSKEIEDLQVDMASEVNSSALLKIEQTKLNGQIETLKVMLSTLTETAKRIEDKIDKAK